MKRFDVTQDGAVKDSETGRFTFYEDAKKLEDAALDVIEANTYELETAIECLKDVLGER